MSRYQSHSRGKSKSDREASVPLFIILAPPSGRTSQL